MHGHADLDVGLRALGARRGNTALARRISSNREQDMKVTWKIGTIFVMVVGLIIIVMGGIVDGNKQSIASGSFLFVVALIFNLVGWSGKGLSRKRER